MAYKFTFDLSELPIGLFKKTEKYSQQKNIHQKISEISRKLVEKFDIDKMTGLLKAESIILIEDIIEIHIKNQALKKFFKKSKKRAVFLPHCCRKYMDSNCKATFNSEISSYTCQHCSKDCMVSQATTFAKKEGYDVYILPGASCASKIFQKTRYGGIIGIACTDELKLAAKCLMEFKIPGQGIPLIKNGCSGTIFDFSIFKKIIVETKEKTNC